MTFGFGCFGIFTRSSSCQLRIGPGHWAAQQRAQSPPSKSFDQVPLQLSGSQGRRFLFLKDDTSDTRHLRHPSSFGWVRSDSFMGMSSWTAASVKNWSAMVPGGSLIRFKHMQFQAITSIHVNRFLAANNMPILTCYMSGTFYSPTPRTKLLPPSKYPLASLQSHEMQLEQFFDDFWVSVCNCYSL